MKQNIKIERSAEKEKSGRKNPLVTFLLIMKCTNNFGNVSPCLKIQQMLSTFHNSSLILWKKNLKLYYSFLVSKSPFRAVEIAAYLFQP